MGDAVITHIEPFDEGVTVTAQGEINFNRSPLLRTELMQVVKQHQPRRLVIDLTQVQYMDSSGVATLVEAMQLQRQAAGRLVLCGMQPKVMSIFQIARLDMVFTIVPDRGSAMTA